ncbi:hypothetical protein DAT1711_03680 [Enterococcus cecorum]
MKNFLNIHFTGFTICGQGLRIKNLKLSTTLWKMCKKIDKTDVRAKKGLI